MSKSKSREFVDTLLEFHRQTGTVPAEVVNNGALLHIIASELSKVAAERHDELVKQEKELMRRAKKRGVK